MRPLRSPRPFDHSEFVFEPKIDGFRALAYLDRHQCRDLYRDACPEAGCARIRPCGSRLKAVSGLRDYCASSIWT
jgi:hypothetical protein